MILAQPVGEKEGNMTGREAVAEAVDEGHGVRGFAGGEQIIEDELGRGVDGEPEPANARGGTEIGADFVELQDFRGEVAEQGIVKMVSVCAETVEPAGNSILVNAQHASDVGAGHAEREAQKGGLDEEEGFVQAKAGSVAAAGKDVLAGLAAEATDIAVLTVPTVGDEGVNGGIGAAKIRAVGMEAGVTVGSNAFGAPAFGFPG